MFDRRIQRLYEIIQSNGLDGAAINPGPTLYYLTGLSFHLMERPVVLLALPPDPPVIVLPELEEGKVKSAGLPFSTFTYNDNPATWVNAFKQAANHTQLGKKKIGVEPARLRVLELRFLEQAAENASFVPEDEVFSSLRIQKDADEIAKMRKAVQIAQDALQATLPKIRAGLTERQVASALVIELLNRGSDPELPFQPIVSGGPNGANPHAVPSDRPLQAGDLLVIDWGAAYQGYFSDLTRTFAICRISHEMKQIYETVKKANEMGRLAGAPGKPARVVDEAAREVIDEMGYGQYFTHRTGHGLGMEGHEHPYMYAENNLLLQPGMVYTVEPGIYIPGQNGVRIEDDVVVTEGGSESLSDFSRELMILDQE